MALARKTIFSLGGPSYIDDPRVREAQESAKIGLQQQRLHQQRLAAHAQQQMAQQQLAQEQEQMRQRAQQLVQENAFRQQAAQTAQQQFGATQGLKERELSQRAAQAEAGFGLDRDRLAAKERAAEMMRTFQRGESELERANRLALEKERQGGWTAKRQAEEKRWLASQERSKAREAKMDKRYATDREASAKRQAKQDEINRAKILLSKEGRDALRNNPRLRAVFGVGEGEVPPPPAATEAPEGYEGVWADLSPGQKATALRQAKQDAAMSARLKEKDAQAAAEKTSTARAFAASKAKKLANLRELGKARDFGEWAPLARELISQAATESREAGEHMRNLVMATQPKVVGEQGVGSFIAGMPQAGFEAGGRSAATLLGNALSPMRFLPGQLGEIPRNITSHGVSGTPWAGSPGAQQAQARNLVAEVYEMIKNLELRPQRPVSKDQAAHIPGLDPETLSPTVRAQLGL